MRWTYETWEAKCDRLSQWHDCFAWKPVWYQGKAGRRRGSVRSGVATWDTRGDGMVVLSGSTTWASRLTRRQSD